MATLLILPTVILTGVIAVVYITYFYASLSRKEEKLDVLSKYPPISIVFAAYNEGKVIEGRLKNIAQSDYPENIEIVIVNDASEDDTEPVSLGAFEKYGLSGKVIKNEKRSGVNFSMGRGITEAKNEIVVCTDADVYCNADAIKLLVSKLLSSDDIGAVTGDLQPYLGDETTKKSEGAYRSIYGKICEWESEVASTYCFNGALYAIKKNAPSTLDIKDGAFDAGIAFSIIKNGYRALYLPSAKVFENIPDDMSAQFKQKTRRAQRLIKATWINRNMISKKYGKFGGKILPLRVTAFLIVPAAFITSLIFWTYIFSSINLLFLPVITILFILATVSGSWRSNLVSSFILHQIYLLFGLFNLFKDTHVWELTERKEEGLKG